MLAVGQAFGQVFCRQVFRILDGGIVDVVFVGGGQPQHLSNLRGTERTLDAVAMDRMRPRL